MSKRGERDDVTAGHEGNDDPLEEVGPEECAPKADQCEFSPGTLDEPPDANHPKFSEELMEAFHPEPDLMVPSPIDGLPEAADAGDPIQSAPAFTFEGVICIEDNREWVEAFATETTRQWINRREIPVESDRLISRSRFDIGGEERARLRFAPDRIVKRWGLDAVELTREEVAEIRDPGPNYDEGPRLVLFVQPLRPRCEFYKRQVFANDGQNDPNEAGHKIVFRNCTARRSVGGAFMGLRDENVFACEYRQPPDPSSVVKHLDAPDASRLRGDAHLKRLPIFGNRSIEKPQGIFSESEGTPL